MTIKILDCTLRDGGYVNDWDFGIDNIKNITNSLNMAKIDFISCGFLTETNLGIGKSRYRYANELKNFIPQDKYSEFIGLITFGKYNINDIPVCKDCTLDGNRVIFKKNQRFEAIDFCKKIKEKGYKLLINPMCTSDYNEKELIELIENINEIEPYEMTIVDTLGLMQKEQLTNLFNIFNDNLNNNIAIGFHSHNNLGLSYENAKHLIEISSTRDIIIDSSLYGMGRGAGNLQTELITNYINQKEQKYDINKIKNIIEKEIMPIYKKTPWGYSEPYMLSAKNACHPNYATYLIKENITSTNEINLILSQIPKEKKSDFDKELIAKISKQTSGV